MQFDNLDACFFYGRELLLQCFCQLHRQCFQKIFPYGKQFFCDPVYFCIINGLVKRCNHFLRCPCAQGNIYFKFVACLCFFSKQAMSGEKPQVIQLYSKGRRQDNNELYVRTSGPAKVVDCSSSHRLLKKTLKDRPYTSTTRPAKCLSPTNNVLRQAPPYIRCRQPLPPACKFYPAHRRQQKHLQCLFWQCQAVSEYSRFRPCQASP